MRPAPTIAGPLELHGENARPSFHPETEKNPGTASGLAATPQEAKYGLGRPGKAILRAAEGRVYALLAASWWAPKPESTNDADLSITCNDRVMDIVLRICLRTGTSETPTKISAPPTPATPPKRP
jgi:hypothetical protein